MGSMGPLISAEELSTQLERVRIYDLRWSLTDPAHGKAAYLAGHLPGAVFVDLDNDLSGPPGLDGRHPLPDVATFARTLGRLGIDPASDVVVYDDMAGVVAARMWWMLQAIGHRCVRLLDGGYQHWVSLGLPVATENVDPQPSDYPVPARFSGVVTRHDLEGRTLIDARAPERYAGLVEPVDPKAGHIPGALNRPTGQNLGPDGRFLAADTLRGIYAKLENPVVSCGSGVNACHDAVAMLVAGYDLPDLYPGSFSEWSRRGLPVETGP